MRKVLVTGPNWEHNARVVSILREQNHVAFLGPICYGSLKQALRMGVHCLYWVQLEELEEAPPPGDCTFHDFCDLAGDWQPELDAFIVDSVEDDNSDMGVYYLERKV